MSILLAILSMPGLLGLYVIWHIARSQIDWLRKDEGEIAPLPSEVPVGKRRSQP